MIIISDTSVITNLAAIEHLHLLPQLYHEVIIPEAVYRELTDLEFPVPGSLEVQSASWLDIRQVCDRSMVERLKVEARLDPGESEAIALALELNADLLLIDERRGRSEANRLGLRISGLLGLLVEAKHRQFIVAVKPLIDNLIEISEFRVSENLYNQILKTVDEL